MLLFLKLNLRAVTYDIGKLPEVLKDFVSPYQRLCSAKPDMSGQSKLNNVQVIAAGRGDNSDESDDESDDD